MIKRVFSTKSLFTNLVKKVNENSLTNIKYVKSLELTISNPNIINNNFDKLFSCKVNLEKDGLIIQKTFEYNESDKLFNDLEKFLENEIKI